MTKKASPTVLVDTTSKSCITYAIRHARNSWTMYVPIYHTKKSRGRNEKPRRRKRQERERERERRTEEIGGAPRSRKRKRHRLSTDFADSKLASTKGRGRPRSQKQTSWWLLDQWRGGQSTQNGKEEKKNREERREYRHAPIVRRVNRNFKNFLCRSFFCCCLSDNTCPGERGTVSR